MSATLLPLIKSSCVRFPIPGRNESWAIRRVALLGVACTAMMCGYRTCGAIAEGGGTTTRPIAGSGLYPADGACPPT